MEIMLKSIGSVNSPRVQAEDDLWGDVSSTITLDATTFTDDSLAGLAQFSHVEVVFFMNQVRPDKIVSTARHPRNNTAWPKIGIFAQRGKNRPNQIGVTVCEVIKIDGLKILVRGLDAIDGTPVLDIKPYLTEFAPRGEVRQPEWSKELMKHYFY
jgi:tRNA-Thr(GGU) m(6)t(6)A37 methyltransferase TsaA